MEGETFGMYFHFFFLRAEGSFLYRGDESELVVSGLATWSFGWCKFKYCDQIEYVTVWLSSYWLSCFPYLKIPFIFDHWNGDLTLCFMFQSWHSCISSEALSNLVFLQHVIFFKAVFCLFLIASAAAVQDLWCNSMCKHHRIFVRQITPISLEFSGEDTIKKSLIVDVTALNEWFFSD